MNDNECSKFLQWALPRLGFRWPGYRKVRNQVCKRIDRRLKVLQITSPGEYRNYLQHHPEEWTLLDNLCRVTISRFYRDKEIFRLLESEIFPQQAKKAIARKEKRLKLWSIGCASGEEPYTLALLWEFGLKEKFPEVSLEILATDADSHMLKRAKKGCYNYGSLKDLPKQLLKNGFDQIDDKYCLKERFKNYVEFKENDIRREFPPESFHLILCRNLIFTYFDEQLQYQLLKKMKDFLFPEGILIIGGHELLPENQEAFKNLVRNDIYQKI